MGQPRKSMTELIQNDKARLATFKRRSHCLLKKASELSTLCDVDVAVLIYPDHLSDRPLTFPPESGETLRIIKKLKSNPRYVPAAKSKPDIFMNQENHTKRPNNNFCDDIMSLNVDELESLVRILDAKEEEVVKKINTIRQGQNEAGVCESFPKTFCGETSAPNCFFFSGDDHQSELFDHQQHDFQWPISLCFMGNEDTAKSKSEQLTENNYGFLNQIPEHLNKHYDDNIMSSSVGELDSLALILDAMEEDEIDAVGEMNNEMRNCLNFSEIFSDEFSDPNCFFFNGDGHPAPSDSKITMDLGSEFFDYQPPGLQWAIPCSYKVDENTPISDPHHLTENSSGLLDYVVPILDATRPEEVKNQSNIIREKTIESPDCESLSERTDCESLAAIFYDELPDTKCLSFNSENPMYETLDYEVIGCQWPIPLFYNN